MDRLIAEVRELQRPYMRGEGPGDVVLVRYLPTIPFRTNLQGYHLRGVLPRGGFALLCFAVLCIRSESFRHLTNTDVLFSRRLPTG